MLRFYTYFSKKNKPAEYNYEIYDKEMLAIIYNLEKWDAELRNIRNFEIRINYKNLKYFIIIRKLIKR